MQYYLTGLFLAGLFGLAKHSWLGQTVHPNAAQENIWKISADSLPGEEIRNDFRAIYEEYQVDGMFVLYNSNSNNYTFYNKGLYNQSSPPASTFNILLTLIGLKEGIIKNEKSRLNNDSVHKVITLEKLIVKELMRETEFTGLAIYGKRGSNKLYQEKKYTG